MYVALEVPNPCDVTLRRRAGARVRGGRSGYDDLAALFELGARMLPAVGARDRAEGTLTPKQIGGGGRSPILLPFVHAVVAEAPDATCAELCVGYNRRAPAAHHTTSTSLWRALRRAGYMVKRDGRARVRSIAPISSRSAVFIGGGGAPSTPVGSASSTKPGRISRWGARTPGSRAEYGEARPMN